MKKILSVGVRVWSVIVCFILGWETLKAEVVRSACEKLVLAGNGERVVLC
jgi:hypothetical protein